MTWSKKITLFYIIVVYFGSKTLQCICCTVRNLLGDNFQYLPSAVNQHKVVSSIENDFHYMIHIDCNARVLKLRPESRIHFPNYEAKNLNYDFG